MESVSAIITTHNRLDLLKRAIESVLRQTYKQTECIVVDDASDDGTEEYCAQLPHITYIRIEKKDSKGGNHARNMGIAGATGEYVAFLDDDDYWLPEKIEKQMELIRSKGNGLVYCGTRTEKVKGDRVSYHDGHPKKVFSGDMSKKILMIINCCTSSLILMRKDLLVEIGMFDENIRFWQDYELTVRAAQVTPFFFVDEPLCVYRKNESDGQRLTNKFGGWIDSVRYIYEKHKGLYLKLSFTENMRRKKVWVRDAAKRCKKEGLTGKYRMYRTKFLLLTLLLIPTKLPKPLSERFYSRELLDCVK